MTQRERSKDGINRVSRSNETNKVVIPTANDVFLANSLQNKSHGSRTSLSSGNAASAKTAMTALPNKQFAMPLRDNLQQVRPNSGKSRMRHVTASGDTNGTCQHGGDAKSLPNDSVDDTCTVKDDVMMASGDHLNLPVGDNLLTEGAGSRLSLNDDLAAAAESAEPKRSPSRVRFADDDRLVRSLDDLSLSNDVTNVADSQGGDAANRKQGDALAAGSIETQFILQNDLAKNLTWQDDQEHEISEPLANESTNDDVLFFVTEEEEASDAQHGGTSTLGKSPEVAADLTPAEITD